MCMDISYFIVFQNYYLFIYFYILCMFIVYILLIMLNVELFPGSVYMFIVYILCHVGDVKCWIISRTCRETSFQSPMSGLNLKLEKPNTLYKNNTPNCDSLDMKKSGLILVVLPSCEIQLQWEAIKKSPSHCKMKNTSFHKMTRSPQLHQSIHKNNSGLSLDVRPASKTAQAFAHSYSCYDTKHINPAIRDSEPSGGLLSNI